MTPEGRVKEAITKLLISYSIYPAKAVGTQINQWDGWYIMVVPTGMGVKGVCDYIGCYLGRFFAIEAKAPGGKVTKLQQMQMDAIRASGGKAFVVEGKDGTEELLRWLNAMKNSSLYTIGGADVNPI